MSPTPARPKRIMIRRGFTLLLACSASLLLISAGCRSAAPRPEPLLTAEQRQLNIDSFEFVWKTIGDNHYDPDMGGVDWQAVHDELRPEIERAETSPAARAVLNDMLGRLKLSHFGVIPASAYADIDPPEKDKKQSPANGENDLDDTAQNDDADDADKDDGDVGLEFRVIGDQAVVTHVVSDTPAAQAGVRPGWVIERINNKEITKRIQAIRKALDGSQYMSYALYRSVANRLNGNVGETVKIDFRDGKNKRIRADLARAAPRGEPYVFGHMPKFYVLLDHRRVDNIGFIRLNAFFHPILVSERFAEIMREFADTDGIVLDLRGNPGGLGGMAMGLSGWFISEQQRQLGTMTTRQSDINFVINPRPKSYAGPLALLTDELTGSTSEIMAGGLQDLGRARVFGRTTAGAALPSRIEMLPNGDRLQFAFADYVSVGGRRLEGNGVIPDVQVPLDREALLAGIDPDLEAARAWIQEQVVK